MNLLIRLEEKENLYNNIQGQINKLNEELLRVQGEYRILKELAIEDGLLDNEGRVIESNEVFE